MSYVKAEIGIAGVKKGWLSLWMGTSTGMIVEIVLLQVGMIVSSKNLSAKFKLVGLY